MTPAQLSALLIELQAQPKESEWLEFKHNKDHPEMIGETLSALANAAALHGKDTAYVVWGIEDGTHKVIGTTFKPRSAKKGNEELENWLVRSLQPQIQFKIHEFTHDGYAVVLIEIPRATHAPIRFGGEAFIRVGGLTKKLKDYPAKEADLWAVFARKPFETGIACADLTPDEVLAKIEYPAFFALLGQNLPENKVGILDRLAVEKVIVRIGAGLFSITNLGAMLFAKNLNDFDRLARKGLRIIIYKANSRVETLKEQQGVRGYAVGFTGAIRYINDQLPANEQIGQALRAAVPMYPEIAIRELVANALIHQDFSATGTSPMIEIFSDRIVITNPGVPLIDPLRFIDEPPQSRNEILAAFMRRLNMCEERGSGIDKVVFQCELFQLPAPDFIVTQNHTKAILFAPRKFASMDKKDRVRACYQHASLCYVSNKQMTNESLRKRFSISDKNYSMASRILRETLRAKLIKPYDPENKSKKHASYVPFWA